MKKLSIILLTLCLVLTLCAFNLPGEKSEEELKSLRNITFSGNEMTVNLGANRSSGYEWDFDIEGDCISLSQNVFRLNVTPSAAIGELRTSFTGNSEGEATITFTTPFGWDGTGPGEVFIVNVNVGADGTIINAVGETGAPRLSSPYAHMLKSGDYQYSYPVVYEGKDYIGTIAAKHGMICRDVKSTDGTYSKREIFINGTTFEVDDLAGTTVQLNTTAEPLPNYADKMDYYGSETTESNGYIVEGYDFLNLNKNARLFFLFSDKSELLGIITVIEAGRSSIDIIEIKSPSDEALFTPPTQATE